MRPVAIILKAKAISINLWRHSQAVQFGLSWNYILREQSVVAKNSQPPICPPSENSKALGLRALMKVDSGEVTFAKSSALLEW